MKDKIKKTLDKYDGYKKLASAYYNQFLSGKLNGIQLSDKYLELMKVSNEYTCCCIRNESADISNLATSLDRSLYAYITNHLPKAMAL